MSYYDENPYYTTGALGLTKLGELNDPHASYDFHDLVVWQHEDGSLYWGVDSGCSCPAPFEDFRSLDNFEHVTNEDFGSWKRLQEAVQNHCLYDPDSDSMGAERSQLLAKAVRALGPREVPKPVDDWVTIQIPRKAAEALYQARVSFDTGYALDYSFRDAQDDLEAALDGALHG